MPVKEGTRRAAPAVEEIETPAAEPLDYVGESPAQRRSVAPAAPLNFESFDAEGYAPVEIQRTSLEVPIFGAVVVYIGSNPHKSVTMVGKIHATGYPQADGSIKWVKTADANDGTEVYDFTAHGTDLQPVPNRMPTTQALAELGVAGRVYRVVEHGVHLHHFQRALDGNGQREFKVLVQKEDREAYAEYVRKLERGESARANFIDQVIKNR